MNNFNIISIVRALLTLSIIGSIYFAFIWFSNDTSGEAGYATLLGMFIPLLWYFSKKLNQNHLKEDLSNSTQKISNFFDNYSIELQGSVKVSKNFKPFRITIENEDPDDPSEWALNETLNIEKPFYELKTKIHIGDTNKVSHVIYNRYLDDKENEDINGFVYRITITNVTDASEDIIFRNKVISSIVRISDANRILTVWDMGGMGNFIKLNQNISLKEGIEKFKFKKADYITLKSGETIILSIAYTAKKQGVYLPKLSFDISYVNARGNLVIELPELIVPKLFGWVPFLSNFKYLTDMNKATYEDNIGITWYLYDEETQKVQDFSFSNRKLSKEELKFMGKNYCRFFRCKVGSFQGTKNESSEVTSIEKHNIETALKVEEELTQS